VRLTGGLGNSLVVANLPYLQGALGATTAEMAWLPVAYVMTNVSMNLLLVKFRQQFGLRAFTEFFLVLYALVTFAHLFVNDLGSAIAVRAAHGMAGAALSTLGLYYTLQAFRAKELRPKVHRVLARHLAAGAADRLPVLDPAAGTGRVARPVPVRAGPDGGDAGLRAVAQAAAGRPLQGLPADRLPHLRLFAPGVALLCAALNFGRVLWWTEQPWIGVALAASVFLIVMAAIAVEHNRKNPLLNLRWLTNGMIARLFMAMMLVRVVLSEQSVGAVGFLRLVGLNNDQLHDLFLVVLLATVAGIAVAVTMQSGAPDGAAGGRPADHGAGGLDRLARDQPDPSGRDVCSQAMLAFGGVLFLGPLLLTLMGRGHEPGNLITFSVLFGLTQNLGGLLGSSLLGTWQVMREKFHSSILAEQLSSLDPLVAARIQQRRGGLRQCAADPASRTRQGISVLSQTATREANILAYNDVFLA
jgi:hypothetical protein